MTYKQLQNEIIFWKRKLGLHEWEFEIHMDHDPKDMENCVARVSTQERMDTANIYFGKGFLDRDKVEIKRTIVHELLHIKRRDLDMAVNSIQNHLSPLVSELWQHTVELENERDIEWSARLIVENVVR